MLDPNTHSFYTKTLGPRTLTLTRWLSRVMTILILDYPTLQPPALCRMNGLSLYSEVNIKESYHCPKYHFYGTNCCLLMHYHSANQQTEHPLGTKLQVFFRSDFDLWIMKDLPTPRASGQLWGGWKTWGRPCWPGETDRVFRSWLGSSLALVTGLEEYLSTESLDSFSLTFHWPLTSGSFPHPHSHSPFRMYSKTRLWRRMWNKK